MAFASLKYDYVFKEVFSNVSILKRFISDVTGIPLEEYHSTYTLRDEDGREFSQLFEIHVLELNKKIKDSDSLGGWVRLFNADSEDELDKIDTEIAEVREAMEIVKRMSLGRSLRWLYEQKLKERRDRWAEDEYVRDEGREEGREEGRDLTLIRLVCRKLAKGKSPEAIAEDLEEELPEIERLCAAAARFAPDYDIDKIFAELHRTDKYF